MGSLVIALIIMVVVLTMFDLWEILMNSFVVSVVLGMLAYFSFSAPWNWIVPIIIGLLWIVYKTGGGSGAGRDGDSWFDSDGGGGFGGGDGGGGGD